MHLKKSGEIPIPKVAFEMESRAHITACTMITDLIERFELDNSSELGRALVSVAHHHVVAATSSLTKAKRVRPGMPRKSVGIINAQIGKKRIGRPSTVEKDRATVEWIDSVIQEQAKVGRQIGFTEAVQLIATSISEKYQWSYWRRNKTGDGFLKYAKTVYYRGKKRTQ